MKYSEQILKSQALCVLFVLAVFTEQGTVIAQGVFASSSEDELKLSVDIAAAPKLIKITGLEDLTIEKTVGDGLVDDLETTACVVMQGGDTYSLQIIANPLTNGSNHYPYKLTVDQNSITRPSTSLDVADSQIETTLAGLQASTADGCTSQPKLSVSITDVGTDDITGAFSAEATIRLIVQPS